MNQQLSEKYRPNTWAEIIAQDQAIKQIHTSAKFGGYSGKSWFISGKSGTGKTSIARIIAGEVAEEFNIDEMDGSRLNMPKLREIERSQSTYGMGNKTGRAYIINEAHRIRADVVTALLVTLEVGDIPDHVVWIFTTTIEGMSLFDDQIDASPLLSRCVCISLAQRGLAEAMAIKLQEIAVSEGLADESVPLSRYVRLMNDAKQNMRHALSRIQTGLLVAS